MTFSALQNVKMLISHMKEENRKKFQMLYLFACMVSISTVKVGRKSNAQKYSARRLCM